MSHPEQLMRFCSNDDLLHNEQVLEQISGLMPQLRVTKELIDFRRLCGRISPNDGDPGYMENLEFFLDREFPPLYFVYFLTFLEFEVYLEIRRHVKQSFGVETEDMIFTVIFEKPDHAPPKPPRKRKRAEDTPPLQLQNLYQPRLSLQLQNVNSLQRYPTVHKMPN